MYSPNTVIDYIDLTNSSFGDAKITTTTLSKFFDDYSYKGAVNPSNNKLNIRIRDWVGWTELLSLDKYRVNTNWYMIYVPDSKDEYDVPGKQIVVSENELVPVFDKNKVIRGYHGSSQYYYELVHPSFANMREMRVYDDIHYKFEQVECGNYDNLEFGYIIKTKSRWATLSDFIMVASDRPNIDHPYR